MKLATWVLTAGLCAIASAATGETAHYSYDALGRLRTQQVSTGASSSLVRSYSYDAVGNRAQSGSIVLSAPRAVSNATTAGAAITLNVTGPVSGTFRFTENGNFLGSTFVSGGVASVYLEGFSLGSHTITASYSEDGGATVLFSFIFTIKVQNLSWLPAVLEVLLDDSPPPPTP